MTLYHFTCAHGRRKIGTGNCLLLPHYHPLLGLKVLWLTTGIIDVGAVTACYHDITLHKRGVVNGS